MMPTKLTANEMLDREFLEIRLRLLDIAAAFDRIERSADASKVASDPRLVRLHQAVGVLTDRGGDRARRVQMVFSDPYDADWRASRLADRPLSPGG